MINFSRLISRQQYWSCVRTDAFACLFNSFILIGPAFVLCIAFFCKLSYFIFGCFLDFCKISRKSERVWLNNYSHVNRDACVAGIFNFFCNTFCSLKTYPFQWTSQYAIERSDTVSRKPGEFRTDTFMILNSLHTVHVFKVHGKACACESVRIIVQKVIYLSKWERIGKFSELRRREVEFLTYYRSCFSGSCFDI